ncbi:BTB/POZ and MATH domain-containing protein 4-like [Typha latifolia]|uniref:BTB/POZ and MATH domain-containing protein 4-like n=1 Tax=Typha latifolia TaxID=4733 RepID=UPI003C2E7C5A
MIPGHLPPPPPTPARDLSASPTSSCTVTETVKGSHTFVIQGYSLTKGMGVGKSIASDAFSVGGYQWAIYFFPDGILPEDNALCISVCVGLSGEGTEARAIFELVLVDQSGKGRHLVRNQPLTLMCGKSMWGYRCLYERAALETSDFLRDDCLKIKCTVSVVVSRRASSQQHLLEVPDPDMGSHITMLLEDRESSDVVFDVAGEKFHAHKLVLAARSPVFKAKFFDELNDAHGEIAITDMEPEVFKAMLHYIYKDTLVGDDVLAASSSVSSVSDTLAAKLFAAADKYEVGRLRQLCESYLCKYISVDSVSAILAFADQHHATELKAVCLQFSADNLEAVMQSEGFGYLKENFPSLQLEIFTAFARSEDERSSGGKS